VVLADRVGAAVDLARGFLTSSFFPGDRAAPLAKFTFLVALVSPSLVDFFARFLSVFLADFFLASFFFFADFTPFFAFFEFFFAIGACFPEGIRPPPNANPGSSQKAFDVR
jgi:hypothetical protein